MTDDSKQKNSSNPDYVPSTLVAQFLTSLWIILVSGYLYISPIMKNVNIDGGIALFCLIPIVCILSVGVIIWYITEKTNIRSLITVTGLTLLAATALMMIGYGALFLYDIWV